MTTIAAEHPQVADLGAYREREQERLLWNAASAILALPGMTPGNWRRGIPALTGPVRMAALNIADKMEALAT